MKRILTIIILLFAFSSFAEISMRKCTVLPITDSVDGVIAFKVFEKIEFFLQDASWCDYKSNSSLLTIFDKYRNNLKAHLKNPKVVKLVANRLNVGSVIRINVENEVKGAKVELDILGENGEDIYLSEKVLLQSDSIDLIVRTIKNWLNLYEKNIPYQAKVTGILGDQLTINIGRSNKVKVGNNFVVKRPIRKKRHPLLKQIVEWETEVLAKGKVFSVSSEQSLAMVKVYTRDKKINVGDWVNIDKESGSFANKVSFPEAEAYKFGKIGTISVTFDLSNSKTSSTVNTDNNSAGGLIYGFSLLAEGWITRNYFAMFEMSRRFGSQSQETGTLSKSTVDITSSKMKLLAGYKYLPLGYFYGPQIDAYTGVTSYTYSPDNMSSDGFGEGVFSGFTVGARANVPVHKLIRALIKIEMLIFDEYEDSASIGVNSSSTSTLEVELGVRYDYSPLFTLDAAIERLSNKVTASGSIKEIQYQDTIIKGGVTFKF